MGEIEPIPVIEKEEVIVKEKIEFEKDVFEMSEPEEEIPLNLYR